VGTHLGLACKCDTSPLARAAADRLNVVDGMASVVEGCPLYASRRCERLPPEDGTMLLIAFVATAVLGQIVNVSICVLVDKFAPAASFMVFFGLYLLVFWLAWRIALRITEKDFLESLRRRFVRTQAS
jgi:hypothetical protein